MSTTEMGLDFKKRRLTESGTSTSTRQFNLETCPQFEQFELSAINGLINRQITTPSDFQDYFKSFKLATKDILEKARFSHIATLIESSEDFSAIAHHLNEAKSQYGIANRIFEKILDSWPMLTGLSHEASTLDSFENNAMAAKFESALAQFILQYGSKKIWRQVNAKIIKYIRTHYDALDEYDDLFKEQLIQYKLCSESDFNFSNGRDKFIQLLRRKVGVLTNVTECASLHLIFFNFNHLYKPERDVVGYSNQQAIIGERANLHRKLRPNAMGQMFSPVTRGRMRVESTYRTCEFGISDLSNIPDGLRAWHKHYFTPHKYLKFPRFSRQ